MKNRSIRVIKRDEAVTAKGPDPNPEAVKKVRDAPRVSTKRVVEKWISEHQENIRIERLASGGRFPSTEKAAESSEGSA